MILESGASISVVPPSVGREYEVVRGEAAMAGVRYEIADGNEIPNFGEKLMPVVIVPGANARSIRFSKTQLDESLRKHLKSSRFH